MVFITGRNKRSIEDHFDVAYELEAELENSGKTNLMSLIEDITPRDMHCVFIRQARALGLGQAVLCAEPVIAGEPFAVLLADELVVSRTPALLQLKKVYESQQASVVGLKQIAIQNTGSYGIVAGKLVEDKLIQINTMIEKPKPKDAPSTSAIAGRYVLTPTLFDVLKDQTPGAGGEIQLTDALVRLSKIESMYGLEFEGQTFDCGSKLGFLQASVEIGLKHDETGADFTEWLAFRGSQRRE
jgi:UTP--glucose-1-phosphate uridylyltransferase